MSFRTRLTITMAAVVALVVVAGAYAAHYNAARELRAETDTFLLDRSQRFLRSPLGRFEGGPELEEGIGRREPFVDYDAVTQVISADGSVVASLVGQPSLPVDGRDLSLARDGGTARLRSVTVNGTDFRMLTASLPGGGAVQIARDTSETEDVLAALRNRLALMALIGTAVAALVAWLVAKRLTRPIEQLTQASEHIAATQDLSTAIPVDTDDEIGRLAASFNTMLVALDTSREQQKRLVADASHELRTPLTAVRTNLDFLQRAASLDPSQRAQLLAETRLELDELTNLVTELVELATDARTEEPVEPVDLGDVAGEVAARYRRRTGRAITVSGSGASVEGRRSMIDRAVSNLVDNALKFSDGDTPIEICLDGGRVEVLDRGPGIAAEDRSRVFDRFYRATTARTLPGSGLGLAIVKQIAELHGGTASLDERDGGGTVARLDLPVARAAEPGRGSWPGGARSTRAQH